MKREEIVILLLGLAFYSVLGAEDAAVATIKKNYAETAAAIALAQKGEQGAMYCNELLINSRGGSWRAVGNYLKKAVFWYSDQPEFALADGKGAETVLAKVEVRETAAARSDYREFFFAGGQLVFYLRSAMGEADTLVEERIYFKDGKVLRHLLAKETVPGAFATAAIFREASYWQKLFLLSFNEAFSTPLKQR
jgi:hypothetical protein